MGTTTDTTVNGIPVSVSVTIDTTSAIILGVVLFVSIAGALILAKKI